MNEPTIVNEEPRPTSLAQVQQAVTRVWEECLERDGIGISDNFFDLGGSSITAMHIATLLNEALAIETSFQQVMELGDIGSLSHFVYRGMTKG
jgi:acyl carrier protein